MHGRCALIEATLPYVSARLEQHTHQTGRTIHASQIQRRLLVARILRIDLHAVGEVSTSVVAEIGLVDDSSQFRLTRVASDRSEHAVVQYRESRLRHVRSSERRLFREGQRSSCLLTNADWRHFLCVYWRRRLLWNVERRCFFLWRSGRQDDVRIDQAARAPSDPSDTDHHDGSDEAAFNRHFARDNLTASRAPL